MEFSSRHTKMIVINRGVPFRVVLNLVTFCILSSFNRGVSQTPYQSSVMTLHAVVKGVFKRGQKETKKEPNCYYITAENLRSRRLEVVGVRKNERAIVGARKNERARGRHAYLPLMHPFFAGPATQAKPLNEENTGSVSKNRH